MPAQANVDDALLGISTKRWAPSETDWRCVTDLRVVVVDGDCADQAIEDWPLCVWLAAELAEHAAVVWIDTPRALYVEPQPRVDVQRLAWDCLESAGELPPWWTRERELIHGQRRERFHELERARRGWHRPAGANVRPDLCR